jgi:hypothetical protein
MDVLEQVVRVGLMLAGLGVVLGLMVAALMFVFKLATGIDEQIQE